MNSPMTSDVWISLNRQLGCRLVDMHVFSSVVIYSRWWCITNYTMWRAPSKYEYHQEIWCQQTWTKNINNSIVIPKKTKQYFTSYIVRWWLFSLTQNTKILRPPNPEGLGSIPYKQHVETCGMGQNQGWIRLHSDYFTWLGANSPEVAQ